MNEERRAQLRALLDKVYRDAMSLDVDSSLGKDSGASQLGTLVNSWCRLSELEAKSEAPKEQAQVYQFPTGDFLPGA